jgi:voltage-gated potassium channel Kch
MKHQTRKLLAVVALVGGVVVCGYSFFGMLMAATFTGSAVAAVTYAVLLVLGALTAILAVAALRRLRRQPPS